MKLVQQRLLRGPNRHALTPCLMALIDLEQASDAAGADMAALGQRLVTLLPGLRARGVLERSPGNAAELVLLAWTELHAAAGGAGHERSFEQIEPVAGQPGQRRLILAYAIEHVAQGALALALELVDALLHGRPFCLEGPLAALSARAARYRLPPAAERVRQQALAAGIPVMRLSEHAGLLQLGWGNRQWRYLEGADSTDTSALLGRAIARDRQLVRALLDEAAIPVPRGAMADNVADACLIARRLGGPVWVRPLDPQADHGHAVARLGDEEVTQGFADACRVSQGSNGGRGAMIERVLDQPLTSLPVRAGVVDAVGVPAELAALAIRAAAKIGLADAAVDLAVTASGRAVVAALRPTAVAPLNEGTEPATRGDGRIPVIAVTGTNGKTTTTLMIAHATRLAGLRTGYTTTQGVFRDGVQIARGDCTGYWSHRTVLTSPDVDIAVLETARGGILKRGLAYDRCTVGVMVNVSDDHLGMEGIDTVEQLARVKGLVLESAAGAAVLNADDPNCVALAGRLRPGAEILYFSMHAFSPLLATHLAGGGRALCLVDEQLVLRHGAASEVLMRADAIPATMGGHARFNIANSLAAAAALTGAGFTPAQVVAGLASFVSDAHTNPLRLNVFEVRGIRLIVDYAHNPAAYDAIGAMARALAPQRVIGIVTSPGDRRDTDLQRIGRTCASHFDKLVVYESASRGRPHGQAASLIRAGAESAAGAHQQIVQSDTDHEALRCGMALCEPGDVLAFFCGSNLDTVIDALRPMDAAAAEQLAAQIH